MINRKQIKYVILINLIVFNLNSYGMVLNTLSQKFKSLDKNLVKRRLIIDTKNSVTFIECVSDLKLRDEIRKWNSVNLNYRAISKKELYIATRTSFSSEEYLEDILRSTRESNLVDINLTIGSIVLILLNCVFIPQVTFIPRPITNLLGVSSLAFPFVILTLSLVAPDALVFLKKAFMQVDVKKQEDRIAYHEAGHFLVGYLCGVPILQYDVGGEKDAGTMIEIPISNTERKSTKEFADISAYFGNLIVVAMAGLIAETLRFGNSKGGAEDLPVVYEVNCY